MPTRRLYTYADAGWNVAHGCTPVSAGCDHCWAAGMACRQRNASTVAGRAKWSGEIITFPERLSLPLRWRDPRIVAVQFMGDLFHPGMLFESIAAVFGVMAACPQHTFLLLTKRPEVMRGWFSWIEGIIGTVRPSHPEQQPIKLAIDPVYCCEMAAGKHGVQFGSRPPWKQRWPIPNVWLGISAEDQPTLEERWKHLRDVPAAKRWISLEPLLADVNIHEEGIIGPDWIVVGAESGRHTRACPTGRIRSLVHDCRVARIPVHVKQIQLGAATISDFSLFPHDLRVREWPNG